MRDCACGDAGPLRGEATTQRSTSTYLAPSSGPHPNVLVRWMIALRTRELQRLIAYRPTSRLRRTTCRRTYGNVLSGLYLEFSVRGYNGRAGGSGDGSPLAGSRGKAVMGDGDEAPISYRYNEILCL